MAVLSKITLHISLRLSSLAPHRREEVKIETDPYLRAQYTTPAGEMICQICRDRLPFKLDDGSYYFEKVEYLPELQSRHYQNYLALCPNHAAMYQYANGSRNQMKERFMAVHGNELEIILAQQSVKVYFTKTHIADLKTILGLAAVTDAKGEDQFE